MDVLLVDDDQDIRSSYGRLLERAGYTVVTAENGLEALAVVQREQPSVIVCDIRMAFLEGRQFYRELREEEPELADRVVFITGAGGAQDIREFAGETGRPILLKPVDADVLIAAVQRAGRGRTGF